MRRSLRWRADSNSSRRYGSSVKRRQCGQVICHASSRAWAVAMRAQRGQGAGADIRGIVAEIVAGSAATFAAVSVGYGVMRLKFSIGTFASLHVHLISMNVHWIPVELVIWTTPPPPVR